MSDPRLGSERNLADHREENPFDASDRFFGAPPGKYAAPSTPVTDVEHHHVTTVTSDVSGLHLRTLLKLLRALPGLLAPPPATEMGD